PQSAVALLDRPHRSSSTALLLFLRDLQSTRCVTASSTCLEQNNTGTKQTMGEREDLDIITIDDTPEHKQQYDAFILYVDQDIDFVTRAVKNLEERGMRLCLKDRDILAGGDCEHTVLIRLIKERCRRLVVIISRAFLESPMNMFIVKVIRAMQIEQHQFRIIPCVIERCEIPQHMNFSFQLDYLRLRELFNFWDRLTDSIRGPVHV
uniref:Uncharacterized protein n=1 Tax=Anopheles albimanus TaxID=7167 RepID=A0A182FXQ1_ANOAL